MYRYLQIRIRVFLHFFHFRVFHQRVFYHRISPFALDGVIGPFAIIPDKITTQNYFATGILVNMDSSMELPALVGTLWRRTLRTWIMASGTIQAQAVAEIV